MKGKRKRKEVTKFVCVSTSAPGSTEARLTALGNVKLPKKLKRFERTKPAKALAQQKLLNFKSLAAELKAIGKVSGKVFAALRAAPTAKISETGKERTVKTETAPNGTKTTKTIDKFGESDDNGGSVTAEGTLTYETEAPGGARSKDTTKVIQKVQNQCPDANGVVRGSLQYINERFDFLPKGKGGLIVKHSKVDYTVKYVAQVNDNAAIANVTIDEDMKFDSYVRERDSAGDKFDTVQSQKGSVSATASGGLDSGFAYTSAPTITADAESLVGTMINQGTVRTIASSIWKDTLESLRFDWSILEKCVKMDVDPSSIKLKVGQSAPSNPKLTRLGKPLDKPIKATAAGGYITVSPDTGSGPTGNFVITRVKKASGDETVYESRSRLGVGRAIVRVDLEDDPPPVAGPDYAGSFSGTTVFKTLTPNITVSWTGMIHYTYKDRYPTGQGSGAPPGDYWYYEPNGGTINVSINKPAADANDCAWNGNAALSVVGTGYPDSSVQADDNTPNYFFFTQPGGSDEIPFSKTGPESCDGPGTWPLYGSVVWLSTNLASKASSSTTLQGTASNSVPGFKDEYWSWNLIPIP